MPGGGSGVVFREARHSLQLSISAENNMLHKYDAINKYSYILTGERSMFLVKLIKSKAALASSCVRPRLCGAAPLSHTQVPGERAPPPSSPGRVLATGSRRQASRSPTAPMGGGGRRRPLHSGDFTPSTDTVQISSVWSGLITCLHPSLV